MIELVRHNSGVLFRQSANHAHVGHVARGEDERALAPGERRELFLERLVFGSVPGHEVRGAAADAVFFGGADECTHDLRMVLETEIVVTAKVDRRAGVDASFPLEAALLEVGERGLQRCRVALHAAPGRAGAWSCAQPGPWTCSSRPRPGGTRGSIPSRCISARSRATSGLPVVSSFSP